MEPLPGLNRLLLKPEIPRVHLVESPAPAVQQGKKILSKGNKCQRLVLDLMPHFPIAVTAYWRWATFLNKVLPKAPYVRVTVQFPGQEIQQVYANFNSLVLRFDLPEKIVRKIAKQEGEGFLIKCISLARDKSLFMEKAVPDDEVIDDERRDLLMEPALEERLCSFDKIVAEVRKRELDCRLSRSIFPLEGHSLYVNRNDFIAVDDPKFSYKSFPHVFKGSKTREGRLFMRETLCHKTIPEPDFRHLAEVHAYFKNVEGVLSLQESSVYINKYGQRKIAFFHDRYEMSLVDLLSLKPLTKDERKQIALQLLIGLKNLNQVGCHNRLDPHSILVRFKGNKWEAVIGYLKEFFFFKEESTPTPFPLAQKELWPAWQERSAPELIEGNKIDPKKTDVWSMGMVLFELLENKPLSKELLSGNVRERPMGHYIEKAEFEKSVQPLIRGMLQYNPRSRWSAEQCLDYFKKEVIGVFSLLVKEDEKE